MAILAAGVTSTPASAQEPWELIVCADSNAPPFSHRDGTGFEVEIAEILAEEVGASLSFNFFPAQQQLMNEQLRIGACDVIMGVPEGGGALISTLAYYRAPYVFVQRAGEEYDIRTLDDPMLQDLRIGVQPIDSPAHQALLKRGLSESIVLEVQYLFEDAEDPLEPIIAAVADGEIDIAVVWGPAAGYYAEQLGENVVVTPLPPFDPPFTPMFINMTAGVRLGDVALRDLLDVAIVNRWDDIQNALARYSIPVMQMAPPILTLEER